MTYEQYGLSLFLELFEFMIAFCLKKYVTY